MFSFIDGSLLHEFDGNTKHLKKMGQLIGSLSKALCDFKHHGRSNNFPWDIQNINFLKNKIKHIKNIEEERHRLSEEVKQKQKLIEGANQVHKEAEEEKG